MAKTLIAIPCMDKMDTRFVQSLLELEKVGETAFGIVSCSLIYGAREELTEKAINCGADYILWLDSDMVFNPDLLKRLLEDIEGKEDVGAVCGLFFRRRPPYTPAMWKTVRMGIGEDHVEEPYDEYPENQVFEIDACGMAATLMRVEALKKCVERENAVFQPYKSYGEDVTACIRVRKCGYKILCDSRIKVGHIGQIIIDDRSYKAYKANGGLKDAKRG